MGAMTPLQFVERWRELGTLTERQGAQMHFTELCDLLGEPHPDNPDSYCFERGVEKAGGGDGWADVWRKHRFAWEYKGKHKDLGAALRQLQTYTLDLEMPPYLVVSDMARIIAHTNWNNTVSERHEWALDDLLDAGKRDLLRQVFNGSDKLKPGISPQELTAKAAQRFGDIGRRLQERKHDPRTVAHFLNRLIFCMFAEDAGLLPNRLFTRMMRHVERDPEGAAAQMRELFGKMHKGGYFGVERIDWFNGGLFDGEDVLPLEVIDLKEIAKTADEHDWSEIDPAIFGTLFEQALKATRERPALGAHYTDREKILKIVDPVIARPLMAEWEAEHAEIAAIMAEVRNADAEEKAIRDEAAAQMKADPKAAKAGEEGRRKRTTAIRAARTRAYNAAKDKLDAFLDRLSNFRVLDPACGSGNFLYVALHALHDIERRAHGDVLRLGLEHPPPRVSVKQLRGIEVERYAAELARVTLWIGDLQWLKKNGYLPDRRPILDSLDQIEERDALLDRSKGAEPKDWPEAEWPETDVIIGNPPFVGGKRMRDNLGDAIVDRLFEIYVERVPAEADFVCYWVEKAWQAIGEGRAIRGGLVTTNSIRGGANRKVIDAITDAKALHEAWSDDPWVVEGAAVRVSQIGFGSGFTTRNLDGLPAFQINSDLTGSAVDLTKSAQLTENAGVAFMGDTKGGSFDVPGDQAREWLLAPSNPNGRPNADVMKPWRNGADITRRPADKWIIDFGWTMRQQDAALYELPFRHVVLHVEPERRENKRALYRENWWRHVEPRPGMWSALDGKSRYILTPRVATYRSFVWTDVRVCPDSATIAVARDDDTMFGILHSRFHETWALRLGTWLGKGNDPRYTPTTTFETFPFPEGLTPNIPASDYANDPRAIAIAEAARELNEKREAWLNPREWVDRVPEVVPGYPDRIVPKNEDAAKKLKDRTLTKLYNERPAWLDHLHQRLDEAVAAAYGWPADLSDEEILERLFALNQERAAAGR